MYSLSLICQIYFALFFLSCNIAHRGIFPILTLMNTISWQDFESVELRVGTIIRVEDFPEARKSAYKLWVDFGWEIGTKQSSAQITVHYSKEELLGKQIVGVVNFPPKKIWPFVSEFLCTGFYREDGSVILAIPESAVPNGAKLG